MEEDIKILETLKESYIKASECGLGYPSDNREDKRTAQALESLIKGYKELEEENAELKEESCCMTTCMRKDKQKLFLEEKTREMIEEKQKRIDKMHPASDCVLIDDLENQIDVLKELLENK